MSPTISYGTSRNVFIEHQRLAEHWKGNLYPPSVHNTCISLLKEYNILFKTKDPQKYILMPLLPYKKPDIQLLWLKEDKTRIQYERMWQFKFIPQGLFEHCISCKYIYFNLYYNT